MAVTTYALLLNLGTVDLGCANVIAGGLKGSLPLFEDSQVHQPHTQAVKVVMLILWLFFVAHDCLINTVELIARVLVATL